MHRRYGTARGTVYVGLIWTAWHLPINLAGYDDSVHPFITTMFVFPAFTIAMSFVLAWLAGKSGSVWPAALAHGANNAIGSAFLMAPNGWRADVAAGLAGALSIGLIFAFADALSCRRIAALPVAACSGYGDGDAQRPAPCA